jgi:NADPH:quinone reductase-like Zn-dependent oxidoreductase
MKAAVVNGPNEAPVYGEFEEPSARPGSEVITVSASALSRAARWVAAGSHYSASGVFPVVAGIDGVGHTEGGQRVYFGRPNPPFGGMAEKALVPSDSCIPLSDEVGDVVAAAIANPGMSSVAALRSRAAFKEGETVLVNGATGTAGRLAVQLAKHMGARKVIATGRDPDALRLAGDLGADVTISLSIDQKDLQGALTAEFRGDGVDIVLDYVWGKSAETLLSIVAKVSDPSRPVRYVEIGSTSGPDVTLPSALLRAVPVTLMGSGFGSVPPREIMAAVAYVMRAVVPAKLRIETTEVPLAEVGRAWSEDIGRSRMVFVVGGRSQ